MPERASAPLLPEGSVNLDSTDQKIGFIVSAAPLEVVRRGKYLLITYQFIWRPEAIFLNVLKFIPPKPSDFWRRQCS